MALPAFAATKGCPVKTAKIKYIKPIDLTISASGVNRISLAPHIITTIWGDGSEYSATLSNNGSELFITSKVPENSKIVLAVGLAGGKVVDLMLNTVKASVPKIINLNLQNVESKSEMLKIAAKQMLKAMRMQSKGKYYVREVSNQIQMSATNSLLAKQERIYQFGNLIGTSLTLQNKGKSAVSVNALSLVKAFKDVVAVQVDNVILTTGQKTKAFLVMQKREV
jgi:hypothetical protein